MGRKILKGKDRGREKRMKEKEKVRKSLGEDYLSFIQHVPPNYNSFPQFYRLAIQIQKNENNTSF